MAARLSLALRGDLRREMEAERRAFEAAGKRTTRRHTTGLKTAARAEIVRGFGGGPRVRRAANAVRDKLFEGGAVGLVYSKFGRREGGAFVDYLAPHVTGAEIRPVAARRLFIPLQKGRRARSFRAAVALQKNLRFIRLDRNRTLIVRQTRTRSTPIALLVRRVRIKAKLNFDKLIEREAAAMPETLNRELDRAPAK